MRNAGRRTLFAVLVVTSIAAVVLAIPAFCHGQVTPVAQVVPKPPPGDFVIHTLGAGIDTALVPKKLDMRLAWNYSRGTGKTRAFNPVPPSGGTAAQNTSAAAVTFPETSDRLQQLEASLRYRFTPALFARLRYIYETFDITDFRTDTLQPFMGGTDVFLGAQIRDYTAHILALSVGYRF